MEPADDIHFDITIATGGDVGMKAVTDAQGRPTAWLQRSVFPPIGSTFDAAARYGGDDTGMGDLPFDIPNLRAENGPAQPHVRIGWLRPALAQAIWPYGSQRAPCGKKLFCPCQPWVSSLQGHLVFHVNPDERQCLCLLGRQLTARCCNIRIASPPEQANRGAA